MPRTLKPKRPSWAAPDHDPESHQATLVDHLEELRDRIIRCLFFVAIAWVIGWFLVPVFYGFVNDVAKRSILPSLPPGVPFQEKFNNATEPFMLQMRLSFSIGLLFAIPFIVGQIWAFVAPGLRPQEQAPFRRLAPFTVVLFLMGAGVAWLVLPSALTWFTGFLGAFPGVGLYQDAGSMAYFFIKMMTAFGIAFQLPIVVFALGMLGLLTSATLLKYWRHSATFIFIAAAVITPSNDPFSMLMMAVPMTILFMGSVYAVKFAQRDRPVLDEDDTSSLLGDEDDAPLLPR